MSGDTLCVRPIDSLAFMEWSPLGLLYMLGLILKVECLQHLQEERLGSGPSSQQESSAVGTVPHVASLTAAVSLALPFPTPEERFNKCWSFPPAFS